MGVVEGSEPRREGAMALVWVTARHWDSDEGCVDSALCCMHDLMMHQSSSTASRRTFPPPSQLLFGHARRSSQRAILLDCVLYARGASFPPTETSVFLTMRHSPIQEGAQDWKSRTSIRSRDSTQREPPPPSATLTPHLCYGCYTTLTSRSSRPAAPLGLPIPDRSTIQLPLWVGSGMHRSRLSGQQMKDVVSEFLLEGDI